MSHEASQHGQPAASSHGRPAASHQATPGPISLTPSDGWHCQHLFFRFDRAVLAQFSAAQLGDGRAAFAQILDPANPESPTRLQAGIVMGHKADFSVMILDPDPLKLDRLKQRLLASPLGPALVPTYSYVSVTEVSEYVPTLEQYSAKLIEDGEVADSPAFKAKVKAYESREVMMREQRLRPVFPEWPSVVFYPMNKWRDPHANWFTLPFQDRYKLMAEHGRSGMAFGGKVTQLITVGLGFDDWEWGVTLWARNPEFLKDIVYKMRFDEASAKYAEFGPFYQSYITAPAEILQHCHV
jgi:peroxiredoxin